MLYTRPLVTPLTRPLTGKVLKQFDPLSNDPYLLFDAETSMLGELESPTLDLDASDPETLEVITATRSGVATFTDQAGVIQEAEPNTVRVDHVQGEELTPTVYQHIPYTDFSSGWSLADVTQEAANTPSPSPSYNAIRVTAQNNNIYGRIQDYIGVSQDVTISLYVKRDGVDTVVRISSQDHGAVRFNVDESGVSINSEGGLGYDIQEHGNGWWRISASFVGVGYVQFSPDATLGTRSVLLAMPQVEEGTTASDFVPNTTGSPKFIASATYGPRVPMMLIEPSATNLIQNSEDFTQDVVLSNCSVQGGFAAPDGSTNAFKLTEDNTNSLKLFRANNITGTTAGTSHTASIFVKAGERTKVRVWSYYLTNQYWFVDYDLQGNSLLNSGTANTQIDGYDIEDYPDGWKRISVTGQKPVSTYSWDVGVSVLDDNGNDTYQGDGTSGVYIWGAQFEQGSVATSYIPTSGSAVTRNADNLVIDGTAFSDFYNATEGTWYCEVVPKGNDGSATYTFILEYGVDNNDRVGFFYYPSDGHQSITGFSSGSTFYNQDAYGDATNQLTRMSYSYKSGNHKSAINGTSDSDTDAVVASANQLVLGRRIHSGNNGKLIGHIRRILFWPTHSDSL